MKNIPDIKYPFYVIAFVAIIAIIKELKINNTEIPVINIISIFVLVILTSIYFKSLLHSKSQKIVTDGIILRRVILGLFLSALIILWSAFFFDFTKPIHQYFNFGRNETVAIQKEKTINNAYSVTNKLNADCVTTNDCQVRFYPNMTKKSCLRKKLLDEATIIRFISNYEHVILLGDINEPYLRIKDIKGIEGYIGSQFYDAVTIRECNDDRTAQNKKYEAR